MTTKTNKSKDKPVPAICICGAAPVDVTADGFEPQDIMEVTHWMPLPEPPKGE